MRLMRGGDLRGKSSEYTVTRVAVRHQQRWQRKRSSCKPVETLVIEAGIADGDYAKR